MYAVFTVTPTSEPEVAEHTFYEYQRLVQKEAEPELVIQLPERVEGNTGRNPEQSLESVDAKEQAPAEVAVTVAFALQTPTCGLHFSGQYAYTDAQVSYTATCYAICNLFLSCLPCWHPRSFMQLLQTLQLNHSITLIQVMHTSQRLKLLSCQEYQQHEDAIWYNAQLGLHVV